MQRYRDRENLDEYEDELDDRYEDDDGYEDEEDEEEDEEEEVKKKKPRSQEEIRYLELREKLKAKHRSNLRRENGKNGVNDDPRKFIKFNFFGPSEPAIAERVIQQRKSLLETRHLESKASTSQNDTKKASMSSTTMSKNGPNDRSLPSQVKSKAQIIKQTRDYSWLMSEDAEIPKPAKDPGRRKNLPSKHVSENGRSVQVQAKRHESSSHSAKKGYDVSEQRKPSSTNSQARDDRRAPPQRSASNDKRQLELRKQNLPNKQVGSNSGSGSRVSAQKVLPPKKPLPSSDRKMASGSVDRKSMGIPVGNRAPGVAKTSTSDQQRQNVVRSQASSVNNRMEHRRDVQRSSENQMFRKERVVAPKSQIVKRPNENVRQSNMENGHHVKKQKPVAQLQRSSAAFSRDHKIKKRKSPDPYSDIDISSEIRKLFGYDRRRYHDDDDDDMCMEATFEDIDREERRSAKIAKQEDDEEFIKIQEEERREREAALRRKAKKAKMHR